MKKGKKAVVENKEKCKEYNGYDKLLPAEDFLYIVCCEHKGLPESCHELETLYGFWHNFLMKSKLGRELIQLYFDKSPAIAKVLKNKNAVETAELCDELYNKLAEVNKIIEKEDYTAIIDEDGIVRKYVEFIDKYIELIMFVEIREKQFCRY